MSITTKLYVRTGAVNVKPNCLPNRASGFEAGWANRIPGKSPDELLERTDEKAADADSRQVRVFKGEAAVLVGNRKINVGQSEEVTLNSGIKPKEKDFEP